MKDFAEQTFSPPRALTLLSRRGFLSMSAAFGGAALAGPGAAFAANAEPKGQVVVGYSQEPTNFHPLMLGIEVDQGVHWNLYSPLWGVNEKGEFTPQLAVEVPTVDNGGISADGLNWRIKLRDGVKWHDGAPFTADDVKFSLDLLNNPDFRANRRAGHELVRDITIVSPTEITWRMEKVYAPYVSILAWTFIVPKHILEKETDVNSSNFAANPIGTGAFKWSERVPGDHITLKANPDYFGDGPYVETLVFKYIPDLTVMFTQFQTGDIDYTGIQGITADHYAEATKLADRVVMPVALPFIENIAFNLGKPVFQDKAVREALYLALDKQSIIEAIYYGLPRPTESYLPYEAAAFNPDLPKHEYNPEKAKKILDDAGWVPGDDGIRSKNGVRLAFVNSTTAGNHVREQAQQLLQQTWKEIGAELTIQNFPPAVMWGDNWMQSKFDTAMVGIGFMIGPDADTTDYFHSRSINAQGGAGQNTTQYVNPEVDKVLAEAANTVDQNKRNELYRKQQEIVRGDLPYLPIFQYAVVEGTKAGLQGFKSNVNVQTNAWNINEWKWS
ncbi:MAG: peptide ABC transporter substrate-binding protein [Alphaproteobacteria bacterium]|nr:peptide ABC transporter substrate-binding protein [Alphaproteobacteria bacterium]